MLEVLRTGGADITVAPPPTVTAEHVEVLGTEEIVVVAAPDHRFAAMDAVPLKELTDEPLVHYHQDNGMAASWRTSSSAACRWRASSPRPAP